MSDEISVLLTVEGPVATILLNRPDRMNALDAGAWSLLQETIDVVHADPAVRAIVLRGAGGNFCSGADVRGPRNAQHPLTRMRSISDVVRALYTLPKPTRAVVEGAAVGAGMNIALACDLVIAADDARFSQIFARRGLSVDCGGSWLLPRLVGMQQARRLLYFAEMIDGKEAARLGLVLQALPACELDAAAQDVAARLATAPPVAVRLDKELLDQSWTSSFDQQLQRENTAQAVNFATDAPAARLAIEQRSTPVFEGEWQL